MQVYGKDLRIRGTLIRVGYFDGEGYEFLEKPEQALENVRQLKARVDLLTFIQRLSDTAPRYEYHVEWDNMAALPVSSYDHWLTQQIDFKVRNKIRKAAKSGVVVKEVPYDEEFVKGISAIYNESPVRQGKRFWHYAKDIAEVREMNGTFMDRSIFIGAYFENELIGFVKLVSDENHVQAGLMQIISMIQHRDKAPTNALIAQAVRSCATREIPYLWYASFSYGNKQTDSLADFKQHNGFKKIDIPRYYIPLTVNGHIALRFGLQHGIAERIPEPVAATYRRMRRLWYAAKATESGKCITLTNSSVDRLI